MSRYYDYVLGLIPTALIGVTVLLSTAGVSWHAAVPAGAAVAIGVMAHAMFIRAPRPAPAEVVADAASSASDAVGSDAVRPSVGSEDATSGAGRSESSAGHAGSGTQHSGSGT